MLPEELEELEDFNVEEDEEQEFSNDTYVLDFESKRILRKSDEDDEILRQAIIKILLTEFDYSAFMKIMDWRKLIYWEKTLQR